MSVIHTELTLKNEDDAALAEKGLIKKLQVYWREPGRHLHGFGTQDKP